MSQFFQNIRQDLRFAIRNLRKSPGFLAVVILSLALGIGANSTIFSVLDAALYRPLPYPHPEQLVVIWDTEPGRPDTRQNPPIAELNDWLKANHSFQDIALTSSIEGAAMAGFGQPEEVRVQNVTPNYFSLMGAKPRMGRIFFAEEMQDKSIAVVLTDTFWHSKFNADPQILGKTFLTEGTVATVVGVMPPEFTGIGGERLDLWQPINPQSARYSDRGDHWLIGIARLKSGVSIQQAQVEMDVIAQGLASAYPKTNAGVGEKLQFLHEVLSFRSDYLYPLFGAVSCILLIACLNVANLLQSRTESRRREYALRLALGAKRGRLMQQVLIESGVLAGLGCIAGFVLTFAGISLFRAMSDNLVLIERLRVDWRVLTFAVVTSALTAFVFGLAPAWQASRTDPNATLREGERGSVGKSRALVRQGLAVAEIALAMVLLVGAGLMISTVSRLSAVDPGFDPRNIVIADINLPEGDKYVERLPGGGMEKWTPAVDAFRRNLLQKLATIPGVESAASATTTPTGISRAFSFAILGRPPVPENDRPSAGYTEITPGYFELFRIPLRSGRFLNERDIASAPPVVVINETLAHKNFPNEDPLGKQIRLRFDDFPVEENRARQIVGVVGDVKNIGPSRPTFPEVFVPTEQQQQVLPGGTVLIHTDHTVMLKLKNKNSALESQVLASLRQSVAEVDPNIPVLHAMNMESSIALSFGDFREDRNLFALFAGIALFLAVIGIYGVMSYFVNARTHEIGVRVALGALPRDVLELIGSLGLKLSMIGVALGAALAFGLTRFIASSLYGVKPTDPVTYVVVAAVLTVVALLACFIPARRAIKVDPMVALRHE
ncbi:MAG TPA: ABC transporter permease [Candidatus Acidoferrum sp.]|nr:ABC transporter permease [Candidatus Acidoferrum sp.]